MKNRISDECQRALERLLEGNRRFVENRSEHPRIDAERRASLRSGQRPFAVVVACADSRVPVAHVFDQGLGDLFTVRVAGNVASRSVVGSVEFAVAVLRVKLVVVLGHEQCGAVQAAIDGPGPTESIERILEEIRPAIASAGESGETAVDSAARIHVANVARVLVERSETLRRYVDKGDLLIEPLLYRLECGDVERLAE